MTTTEKLVIYSCTICNQFHPWNWSDDCRDNDNRYASVEVYAKAVGRRVDEIEVRSMCDRLEADGGTPHEEAVNINENGECKYCGKEGAAVRWVRFTKRTNDPKLAWLERRLDEKGIKHRRNGRSFHAPILEVHESQHDAAWEILRPVDDIEDDDPRWTAE